jgi:ribosomal-protein-alanine N-acetyltransferase
MNARHKRYAIETGSRVFLRYPMPSDRDEFVALRQNSRHMLERWEPIPPSGMDPWTDEMFDREFASRKTPSEHRWLICTLETGAIAGRICLSAIERGVLQSGRFGYWLGSDYIAKGFMQEGIELALKHSFESLQLHRVSANVMPINSRSIKTLKSTGFVKEGYSEKYLKIQSVWEDHERYAITVEQWNEMNQSA